ncbi:MAG TPA: class I SAM-dependent methyltransferase [Chthoniobacterales bacterium]
MRPESKSELVRVNDSQQCVSSPWEEAYNRFETPEEEIAKFIKRLRAGGADSWLKDARVIELFCGRGNGLRALERLGFTNVEGADLSEPLISQYSGPAKCYVCDCRELPFATASRDIAIIQGGLHHLPHLPEDLERSLREIARILKPGGRFFLVEPWLTSFLHAVHFACGVGLLRRLSVKLDALAVMIDNERDTYENWLSRPREIAGLLCKYFPNNILTTGLGKVCFIGKS